MFRLKSSDELKNLDLFEDQSSTITVIEWPEKIKKTVENRLEITFYYESDLQNRKIKFNGFGKWKNFKINAI